MRRHLRFLLPLAVLGLLALPATASAVHNQDVHSANTSLLFQSNNPTGATNSDIAFWGNRAYVGNYESFRIYDISNPAAPELLSNTPCDGPQNDPVVWQNRLLFLAVDRTLAGPQCGAARVANDAPNGWEGVRIFDVSDPRNPRFVTGVYTDCGAHTITLYPASASRVLLYVSSYPLAPGPTCGPVRGPAVGRHPHHGVIQVLEVPVANPAATREIAEPPINYPGDPDNVFNPAEHDFPLLSLRACHDIAVNVPLRLAAAACAEQVQLWRIGEDGIPNTADPLWIYDDPTDTDGPGGGDVAVDFWHSATFTWDGRYINFIDESFGIGCPTVTPIGFGAAARPSDTGRMFFLRTSNVAKLSHFQIPRAESAPNAEGDETEYCSAHLGNITTTIGRYELVNAWYTGGMDVIDFTNPASPFESAFYNIRPNTTTGSDDWSAYWYENTAGDDNGFWLWGNDIVHGFQVFRTVMQANDIALRRLNPQTQENLIACRITVTPGRLRARASRTITVTVRATGAPAVVPGQAVARVPVRLRGAGVNVDTTTNARGVARVSGVTPTRRGVLTVRVPSVPNLVRCERRVSVAAAARARGGGAGAPVALTGKTR